MFPRLNGGGSGSSGVKKLGSSGEARRRRRLLQQWPLMLVIIGAVCYGLSMVALFYQHHHLDHIGAQYREDGQEGAEESDLSDHKHARHNVPGYNSELMPKQSIFSKSGQQEKRDKFGKLVHHTITSIRKEDLQGLVDPHALLAKSDAVSYSEAIKGREPLLDILKDAGVQDIDVGTILQLPKWSSVTKLYGENGPVIIGLETCEKYRRITPRNDASIGTAGIFNTGTNPFALYLEQNCIMTENKKEKHGGMRWQVPWGKHMLADRKWNNTAGGDKKVNKTNVLPVVLIRDPYTWMQSLCKHPYAVKWNHTKYHCPNLVPTKDDVEAFPWYSGLPSVPVKVKFHEAHTDYDSIAHLWSAWYRLYLEADYPRLMVRFEDLHFHAKEMIDAVCQCAGAVARDKDKMFSYVVDTGKWGPGHRGKQANLVSTMIKYGTDKHRFDTMTKDDMLFAAKALDPKLMSLFQYEIPKVDP